MLDRGNLKNRLKFRDRTDSILLLVGIFAFVSAIYSLRQFKLTIIEVNTIIFIHLFFGLLFGALTLEYKKQVHKSKFNYILHFIWTTIVYGELATGIFYFSNRQFANRQEMTTWKLDIIAKSKTYKNNVPYVTVEIDGFEKDVYISETKLDQIKNINFINLTFFEGTFGYKIIEGTNLDNLNERK